MMRYTNDSRSTIDIGNGTFVPLPLDPYGPCAAIDLSQVAEYVPPPPAVPDYVAAIEAHIEQTARDRSYASAVALASYVGSTVPQWAAEAHTFVSWRDEVWLYAYAQLAAVQAGSRAAPTVSGMVAELPAITWPAA